MRRRRTHAAGKLRVNGELRHPRTCVSGIVLALDGPKRDVVCVACTDRDMAMWPIRFILLPFSRSTGKYVPPHVGSRIRQYNCPLHEHGQHGQTIRGDKQCDICQGMRVTLTVTTVRSWETNVSKKNILALRKRECTKLPVSGKQQQKQTGQGGPARSSHPRFYLQ